MKAIAYAAIYMVLVAFPPSSNTHDVERTFSQTELEALAKAPADTSEGLTGSEIGHIFSTIDMDDPDPGITKWKRLHNAFVLRQNRSQNRRAILEFVRRAMRQERYVKQPDRFETMRANFNQALAFSGLAVDASGTISSVTAAATISEAQRRADELRADLSIRGIHPDVMRFCRAELVADNYFHAVLEATKSIADKLRARSGFTDDGAKLVDMVLCGSAPRLTINDFPTALPISSKASLACSEIPPLMKPVFCGR